MGAPSRMSPSTGRVASKSGSSASGAVLASRLAACRSGAFGFEFGEPGQGPGPEGFDGGRVGVVEVGEGFDFSGVGIFGGVDLVEPLTESGGLLLGLGGAGGDLRGEEGGALGAEDPGGEELADACRRWSSRTDTLRGWPASRAARGLSGLWWQA